MDLPQEAQVTAPPSGPGGDAAPTIRTARLCLRPMAEADAPDLARIGGDPRVAPMLFLPTIPWPVAKAKDFIHAWRWQGRPGYRLAICEPGGPPLGTVGLGRGGEVFYFLDPDTWGKGYATEAMAGFLADVFHRFALASLTADVFYDNPASAHVLRKLGFKPAGEGIAVSAARVEPAPVWLYRLSRTAFEARR